MFTKNADARQLVSSPLWIRTRSNNTTMSQPAKHNKCDGDMSTCPAR